MEQSIIDKIEAYLDNPEEEMPRATKDQIGRISTTPKAATATWATSFPRRSTPSAA